MHIGVVLVLLVCRKYCRAVCTFCSTNNLRPRDPKAESGTPAKRRRWPLEATAQPLAFINLPGFHRATKQGWHWRWRCYLLMATRAFVALRPIYHTCAALIHWGVVGHARQVTRQAKENPHAQDGKEAGKALAARNRHDTWHVRLVAFSAPVMRGPACEQMLAMAVHRSI